MKIIGISAFYHDSAAALLIDGKIVSAAQEERFSRVKHDSRIPINAVNFLLESSNLKIAQIT
jgi:carbamoyltransferase